jgi:hypothetical protein
MRMALVVFLAVMSLPTMAQAQYGDDKRYGPNIKTAEVRQKQPPGTYVVAEGDTLWELSEGLFGDGHYWPVLWSYNPQITNPHWVYPGDLLYLRQRRIINKKAVVFAKSRFSDRPRLEEVLARFQGFVAERKYKQSGRLIASREEKMLLGELDEAYIKFDIPKRILPGEEWTIYRPQKAVIHPTTGKRMGWLVKHLGYVRILNVDKSKPYIKSLVLDSFEEIQRGDMVTKRVWNNELVQPVENRVSTWATVVDTFGSTRELAEHDYILIDKGFNQKVRRGNRLIIRARGDGFRSFSNEDLKNFPWENQGEVMVIEPFENTSMAIVLRSVREIRAGQALEMVRGY